MKAALNLLPPLLNKSPRACKEGCYWSHRFMFWSQNTHIGEE